MSWFLWGLIVLSVLSWLVAHAGLGRWGLKWYLSRMSVIENKKAAVVIPARNEEHNIALCVTHVLASQNVELEVVVVDDGSEDATRQAALDAGGEDTRLTVTETESKPADWAGKAWACVTGFHSTEAEWLLFVDADVALHEMALSSMIEVAEQEELDLLSVYGTWTLVGFWERLCIPAIGWFIRGAVSIDDVNRGNSAFANGQCVLFRRSMYEHIGGHEAVRASVLDDMGIAKVCLNAGAKLGLRWGPWAFRVRLYRSLNEIIEGYRKNLYEGMGRNPVVALSALAFLFTFSVVPVMALFGCIAGQLWWEAMGFGVVYVLLALFRWRLERRDNRPGVMVALLHPLASVLFCWILLLSMTSKRVQWKGRSFDAGQSKT